MHAARVLRVEDQGPKVQIALGVVVADAVAEVAREELSLATKIVVNLEDG